MVAGTMTRIAEFTPASATVRRPDSDSPSSSWTLRSTCSDLRST